MKEKVAQRIISILKKQGIDHIFGIPSGYFLPYMEAMDEKDMDFVLVANEASAGFMATVYGWIKGVPGVCYATIGPGATNLTTGIGSAFLDKAPMIALTSEPSDAYQSRIIQMAIDQQALMRPITKWTTRLHPDAIDVTFNKAISLALAEAPGPVHIGLPDGSENEEVLVTDFPKIEKGEVAFPSEALVIRIITKIKSAKKPLLAVGLTATRFALGNLIAEVALKHSIPVVLTPMAKGLISEDHPCYAGVLFHALSDKVSETYSQADLVIGLGYDPVEFNYESWIPKADLIHIDTTVADIDSKQVNSVVSVLGNPVIALRALNEADPIKTDWDMGAVQKRKAEIFEAFEPQSGSFGPLAVLQELRKALPEDGIMACDVGSHTHLIGQAWKTPHLFGQIMTNGWSSMGFGVPAAIGAKVAAPDKSVVAVSGDGGFMMMAGEMATAKRLGLNTVFVVLVDRSLELIKLKQLKGGFDFTGVELTNNKDSMHNSFFGVPVISVFEKDSLGDALREAFKADGPVIIEAYISPAEYADLILRKHK